MSDLISRSELYNKLFEVGCHKSKLHPMDVMKMIQEEPTAYDIDKVVAELKNDSSVKMYGSNNSGNYLIPVNRAIEIVKHGGVSDDVCEWEKQNDYPEVYSTKCGIVGACRPKSFNCPYCGKKIKVVE